MRPVTHRERRQTPPTSALPATGDNHGAEVGIERFGAHRHAEPPSGVRARSRRYVLRGVEKPLAVGLPIGDSGAAKRDVWPGSRRDDRGPVRARSHSTRVRRVVGSRGRGDDGGGPSSSRTAGKRPNCWWCGVTPWRTGLGAGWESARRVPPPRAHLPWSASWRAVPSSARSTPRRVRIWQATPSPSSRIARISCLGET
jgi:hypothetical protein